MAVLESDFYHQNNTVGNAVEIIVEDYPRSATEGNPSPPRLVIVQFIVIDFETTRTAGPSALSVRIDRSTSLLGCSISGCDETRNEHHCWLE